MIVADESPSHGIVDLDSFENDKIRPLVAPDNSGGPWNTPEHYELQEPGPLTMLNN